MNREIKFRAWDTEHDQMLDDDEVMSTSKYLNYVFVDAKEHGLIYMQYTGLHDKNGKEIYEGDIINLPDYQFNPVQASFMQGVFGVTGADSGHYPLRAFSKTGSSSIEIESPMEVIGNIYENPELLK